MPIFRNVMKSDKNKGDILGYNGHLLWSFDLRALNCHSNLNLISNHIRFRIDTINPLNTCNCFLRGFTKISVISSISLTYFFLLTPVAKQLEIFS